MDAISLLEVRASRLGCEIVKLDALTEDDVGPYKLMSDGYDVWFGLPLEGVAEALNCLEKELSLPAERAGEAWADFGQREWPWGTAA